MSDTQPYPFQKYIDEQKHLDTDETRHQIKPTIHIIDQHFKGQEHLYCDKSQLDENGNFRRPKLLIQAEQRGFKSVIDMMEADKKAAEDAKNDVIQQLITKQNTLEQTIKEQNNLLIQIVERLKNI